MLTVFPRAEARREQQRFSRFSPAGIAISALLLWWALHDVSFGEAWNQLAGIRIVPFIGMVLLATARYPLVTVQWRYILRTDGEPLPFVPLWHATAIGFMANNVLPARTGELARAYAARQLSAVSFSTALASVAVEHIMSGIVLVTMLAVGIWAGGFADGVVIGGMTLGRLARGAGLLVGLALLAAIIIVRWPTPARRMASKIATFLLPARYAEKVEAFAAGLLDGLLVLTSARQSTVVMFWNWVVWLVSAGATWCALLAFNIDVPWSAVFLLQGVFGLVGAIGVIGAFEAVTKFVLVLYAVDATQAVSCAVVWHVSTYLPITVLGLWSLSANQLRLRDFASWGTAGTTTERSRRESQLEAS